MQYSAACEPPLVTSRLHWISFLRNKETELRTTFIIYYLQKLK